MDHATNVFAKDFRSSWEFHFPNWKLWSSSGRRGDPFDRVSKADMEEGIAEFVLGPKLPNVNVSWAHRPYFIRTYAEVYSAPLDLIPTGRTAAVKFVTTAGIFVPKLSYGMYFAPFFPATWIVIFISAGISFIIIFGGLLMQRAETTEIGLLNLAMELATWILAVTIGQYKHSDIPLITGRLRREIIWIVTPVVISWLVLATFIVNIYSAVFSSEATRNFYFETNYTELLQLPLDSWTYILVNESYLQKALRGSSKSMVDPCEVGNVEMFCSFNGDSLIAACNILKEINRVRTELKKMTSKRENYKKIYTFKDHSLMLCANTESLSRVLLQPNKSLTFLISDHDFQKYWQLFVQVMARDRNVKVANNFYSNDSLLSKPVEFRFTSGLHPSQKGHAVARFKVLLSSGIYGLWEKWSRIKYSEGGLRHAEKKLPKENKVDPLSFDNSGTQWVFYAQLFAWSVSMAVLMAELTREFVHPCVFISK